MSQSPPPPPMRSRQAAAASNSLLEFPVVDVWNNPQNYEIKYVIAEPWMWIMNRLATPAMQSVEEGAAALPLAIQQQSQEQQQQQVAASPATPRLQRRQRQAARRTKHTIPATLRLEVVQDGHVVVAWHGTSSAFDGLEDKDALVRTIQRCRVEELKLSPPSVLINWDVSLEECRNVVGPHLPSISATTVAKDDDEQQVQQEQQQPVAVLKEPMGSQGSGIYFVRNVDEIHQIIDQHHQRARNEPEVLEALIAAKNRIPSWVLQAEVNPCKLIRDGRKFHIRSYIVIIERPENDEVLDLYLYHQHEVRIAGVPITADCNDGEARNRLAHITNGALSSTTERTLMSAEPELADLQPSLDVFIAKVFAKHLLTDISRRVQAAAPSLEQLQQQQMPREFAVAGLDLMVTTSGRWYLLEVNVHPAAPTLEMVQHDNAMFTRHLETFLKSLINLVAGQSTDGFYDAFAILERAGMTG